MKQQSLLSLPQILLILIIVAAVLVLPGSDIYTHTHEAWLFNHMMQNRVVLQEDFSMLSGHQPLYGIGVFSYAVAGLAWFFFQKAAIKVLEALLFLGIILLTIKIFKNRNMLMFWYALVFAKVLLPDSYPYLFSMFLFYLGIYLIKRRSSSVWGDIAVTLAGLNHPYIAVSNLATAFLGRWLLFLGSVAVLIVQLLVMKYVFFSGIVNFEFDNLLDLALRTGILFFPFLAGWLPKQVARLASTKSAYYIAAAGILFMYPVLYVPFEMGWQEGISCYYTKTYSEIPQLTGNVRIVDDCRNWIYAFPVRGITTSLSPYYEGQYYQHKWDEAEYLSYISQTNTSYVIFCKDCEIKTKTFRGTGELDILRENFQAHAELNSYVIFNVGKAAGKAAGAETG